MDITTNALGQGSPEGPLSDEQAREIVFQAVREWNLGEEKILVIVPDATRTAPVGLIFRALWEAAGLRAKSFDVMIALGTHQPMSEEAINERLEVSAHERATTFSRVQYFNHAWDDPQQLETVGVLPREEIAELSQGRFEMDVPVTLNTRVLGYDRVVIIGPVFPHEVVGFSGGNKYLFPGVGGPEVLNFFHWLAAIVTNPRTIGHKWTSVRRVIDRAASFVPVRKHAFCLVVAPKSGELNGVFAGTPESAWSAAADLSAQVHIVRKPRPFHTVLSVAPRMYADLWTGGKCMYKLEPVVADGGELIIYAPHITQVSVTHGQLIEEIGYHTRDYFVEQWEQFKDRPWGVLAHSTHVRGVGTMENGEEKPRVRVTLATGISPETCAKINMGYRDPTSIDFADFQDREDEGILFVPKAGEMLFHLEEPPAWARP
jgi:nickel-dependent lactate racemase